MQTAEPVEAEQLAFAPQTPLVAQGSAEPPAPPAPVVLVAPVVPGAPPAPAVPPDPALELAELPDAVLELAELPDVVLEVPEPSDPVLELAELPDAVLELSEPPDPVAEVPEPPPVAAVVEALEPPAPPAPPEPALPPLETPPWHAVRPAAMINVETLREAFMLGFPRREDSYLPKHDGVCATNLNQHDSIKTTAKSEDVLMAVATEAHVGVDRTFKGLFKREALAIRRGVDTRGEVSGGAIGAWKSGAPMLAGP